MARGDQLILTCTTIVSVGGEVPNIAVAVTTDLAQWTVHDVTTRGQWFGSLVGTGPGGTVVVTALEAADPNTSFGARTRVWSSDDLITWTEIVGETLETFLDGGVDTIRSFGEVTIMAGAVLDVTASNDTFVAVGDASDVNGQATVEGQSTNEGRSSHSAGPGPSFMTNWDNQPVGMSTFAGSGVYWIWGPASTPGS